MLIEREYFSLNYSKNVETASKLHTGVTNKTKNKIPR